MKEGLQVSQKGKVTFLQAAKLVYIPADSNTLFDNGTSVKEVLNVGKFSGHRSH